MTDYKPMTDVGCGDPELSEELRDALTMLRDHSDNADFRTLVDDVLAGQCGLVEASGTAAFGDVVFASIAQEFTGLTEDEKRGFAARTAPSGDAPSGDTAASCSAPCASCPGVCALRGDVSH
ncbi:MAG: hypothetical protein ACRDRU_02690 [Pseudonocardiaceae bacterium]